MACFLAKRYSSHWFVCPCFHGWAHQADIDDSGMSIFWSQEVSVLLRQMTSSTWRCGVENALDKTDPMLLKRSVHTLTELLLVLDTAIEYPLMILHHPLSNRSTPMQWIPSVSWTDFLICVALFLCLELLFESVIFEQLFGEKRQGLDNAYRLAFEYVWPRTVLLVGVALLGNIPYVGPVVLGDEVLVISTWLSIHRLMRI